MRRYPPRVQRWINASMSTLEAFIQRRRSDYVPPLIDVNAANMAIIRRVQPFTMTSPARIVAAIQAIDYICTHRIPGDIVECGVWRGGSAMAMALALLTHGDRSRALYLFDTFVGMSPPSTHDIDVTGLSAASHLEAWTGANTRDSPWCIADRADVERNLRSIRYPHVRLIEGLVQDTVPQWAPETIALLRLDTDWYDSTKHELTHLYPRLVSGGICIIDDYGWWQGCRQAVDEYLADQPPTFLHRIDYTGRLLVKR